MKGMRIAIRPDKLNAVYFSCVEEDHSFRNCVRGETISKIYIFLTSNLLGVSVAAKP